MPPGLRLDHVCSFRYRRVVANDHTIRAGATILQLPPGPGRRGYARTRVELQLRLDGRLVVWDSIFNKIGCANRAAATAWAIRHGVAWRTGN